MRVVVTIVVGTVWSIVGCSSPPPTAPCTPGRSEACACVGGGEGAQVCLADGTFGECVCTELADGSVPEDAPADAYVLDAPMPDGSTPDATTSDGAVATTTLTFASPTSDVRYVRGDVFVQVLFTGAEPDEVEFWLDGSVPISRVSFPFTDTWHTDSLAEGTYVFQARATIGGTVVATATRTFDVDRSPPHVVATMPAEMAADTDVRTTIRLQFSEPVAPAAVTDASVSFTADGSALPHVRGLADGDTVITITPTTAPSLPAAALVLLRSTITDRAGNPLPSDFTLAFPYPAWLPAVGAGDLGLVGGADQIRQIEGTNAGVLWILFSIRPAGGSSVLWMARWTAGTLDVLPDPVPLPVDGVGSPVMRLRGSGLPTIAMLAGPFSTTRIEVIALDASDVWSAPVATPTFVRSGDIDLDLEIDSSDAPVVLRGMDSGYDVMRYAAGTWTTPVAGTLTFSLGGQRDLLIRGARYFLAVRNGYACSVRTALEGGSWGAPTTLHVGTDSGSSCSSARLVDGGDGVVRVVESYLARSSPTSSNPQCDVRSFDGAGAWSRSDCPLAVSSVSLVTSRPTGFWATARRGTTAVLIDETFDGPPLLAGTTFDLTAVAGIPAIAQNRAVYFPNSF